MDILGKGVIADVFQCVFLLLCQKLLTRLNRLHLMCHVVKVDCNSRSVLKLDAFDADLVEFLNPALVILLLVCLISVLRVFDFGQLVNAILLLQFIALGQNDLF